MTFTYPFLFLLFPILLLAAWRLPRLQLLSNPLRILISALLITAAAGPSCRTTSNDLDLWMLVDQSQSNKTQADENATEWERILTLEKPAGNSRLHRIDYADLVLAHESESGEFPDSGAETRTNLALRHVLAKASTNRQNRILLFTDGYSTEPLGDVGDALSERAIPVDYRLTRAASEWDFSVQEIETPQQVSLGESFLLKIKLFGPAETTLPISIYRDGQLIAEELITLNDGQATATFADRVLKPGAFSYEVVANAKEAKRNNPDEALPSDPVTTNNRNTAWVEVTSGPRVMLVTRYADDPLLPILKRIGTDVEIVNDPLSLNAGSLTGVQTLILNNVPAHELPAPFLRTVPFFVENQGGGFLMVGGERSFGAGGFHESQIDSLLPVTMELKSEHRKLAVAMAIVLDRSGSMSAIGPDGRSKMELANEGSGRAISLLGAMDAATLFAVDSTAHRVFPLTNIGVNRDAVIERARSVEPGGGGIYVYEGLSKAWAELETSQLGKRHIILFSDAADSEQPGAYKSLLRKMQAADATVSVIGLGTRSDADAKLLEDIANLGGGRCFFSNQASEIPNLFAQETTTIARSTFVDEATPAQSTGRWLELARSDLTWLKQVDGYNLSYLRDGDEAALISQDEYAAPLVAFGRRGVGRTAAVSFPLGGAFSEAARTWPGYGDFVQTLNRWLLGERAPSGIALRPVLDGQTLTTHLFFDTEEWNQVFALNPPLLVLEDLQNQERNEIAWERESPGHYRAAIPLESGSLVRGAVRVGDRALPFGPVHVASSVEFQNPPKALSELRALSTLTEGEERTNLTNAWKAPPVQATLSIAHWFALALVPLLLLDAWLSRIGWQFRDLFSRARAVTTQRQADQKALRPLPEKNAAPKAPARNDVPSAIETVESEQASEEAAQPPDESDSRQRRFARAKRKRR